MHAGGADVKVGGYRRVVVGASIGTFIELYDLIVYGYFATILAVQFFPQQDPTAALLAVFAIFAAAFPPRVRQALPAGAPQFGQS